MKNKIILGLAIVGIVLGITTARADGDQITGEKVEQRIQTVLEANLDIVKMDKNASFKEAEGAFLSIALGDKRMRVQMFKDRCPKNAFCIQAFSPVRTIELRLDSVKREACGVIKYEATSINHAIGGELVTVTVVDFSHAIAMGTCLFPVIENMVQVTVETRQAVLNQDTRELKYTRSEFSAPSLKGHTDYLDYLQNN